jgi:hypothetical protein
MTNHGTLTGYFSGGCRCLACAAAAFAHRRRGLPDGDPRHGSRDGYGNYGCRCETCRAANTAAVREWKKRRAAEGGLAPDDPRHGTTNAYDNWGCRCDDCRAAATRDDYITRRRRQTS